MSRLLLVLLPSLLLSGTSLDAAPLPDSTQAARQSLERLKKALPRALEPWRKHWWSDPYQIDVRLARLIAKDEAKVTIVIAPPNTTEGNNVEVATLYLRYFRGSWTTMRAETSWGNTSPGRHITQRLMLVVDEAGEKQDR
jgi:hypothetical protein